jgi:hypothetical protein
MFENWVLSKIFGSNRDAITRDWKGMRSIGRYHSYSSRNITRNNKRKMRLVGHVARMGGTGEVHAGFT